MLRLLLAVENLFYIILVKSLMTPMLGVPMDIILPELPLRAPIRDALAGASLRDRCLLAWVGELEFNRIAECDALAARCGLDQNALNGSYLATVEAADGFVAVVITEA